MAQDKDIPTINLTVLTGWDQLDNTQLRYVFGLLAQGFPSPQVKTYCLFRWTGMRVMHKYGKGWWCKFGKESSCSLNDTMLRIWQEQITLLGVIDTGALLASPKALPLRADGRFMEVGLSQAFLEYGLWQDYGTGRETPAPQMVQPQVLCLSHATERILRGEHRKGLRRDHE